MKIEQIYTGCLAQGAYYIESDGEAAVIDPLRETTPYIKRATNDGATIKYVFETHFHADFVSGHVDLAQKTGAKIVYGPNANTHFKAIHALDGELFKIGKLTIKVLHTPGHTLESSCYLLRDENGKDIAVFTGDTLFIGDVGRPDLAQKGLEITQEDLAGMLYQSLHSKIIPLNDDVTVYPAHGAGSACGKNMSKETTSTIGVQKQLNYALRAASKEQFIKEVTDGLAKPPIYFAQNAALNKNGYENIDAVMARGAQALSPEAFEEAVNTTGALMLDVRNAQDFCQGFIPNAINIGLKGDFAPWVGALIPDVKQPIALITPVGEAIETVMRLARVGYDNCVGYLEGGFEAWKADGKEMDAILSISPQQLSALKTENEQLSIIDVRRPSEYAAEHITDVPSCPLDSINENSKNLAKHLPYYIHCAGGYRSMMYASILKSRGFEQLIDVAGGYAAIKQSELFETTHFVCPSTLKLATK
jgi:hydroxyacylglutathione hydrolase